MLDISITKRELLPSLLALAGVVDKKQSLPILSHIFLEANGQSLILNATDLEIDLTSRLSCEVKNAGIVTVPSRKLVDIVRCLDDESCVRFTHKDNYLSLQSGRSKFRLAALSADDFPQNKPGRNILELQIHRTELLRLLQSTHFAMSQQDVRVYLNGLLFEFSAGAIACVATDGHRMAICQFSGIQCSESLRIVLPRKGVQEILRLLTSIDDDMLDFHVGESHINIISHDYTFMSKLVETRYPAYNRVIPRQFATYILIDRNDLKKALARIMILAHEKTHAIVIAVEKNSLSLIANNQQHEEASEEIEAQVDGPELRIGVNAVYLMDVLNHVPEGLVRLSLVDPDSSILLETLADEQYQYVIMPMKI